MTTKSQPFSVNDTWQELRTRKWSRA